MLKASLKFRGREDSRRRLWAVAAPPIFFLVTVLFAFYGGTATALFPLFYLPILLAASLFGVTGGLVVGLLVAFCAGMVAGPGEGLAEGVWADKGYYVLFGCVAGALFQLGKGRIDSAERRVHALSQLYDQTLSSLVKTLEVRDPSTQGHCERVAHNALVLGKALNLPGDRLELLYWSALLHDMGKIAVPEHILLKDSGLSPGEYDQVKRHADYGADLLLSVSEAFGEVADVVRSHHERYDGTGYPLGLSGEAIPRISRIISVIDVFEALTSRRPYREPMKPVHALHYIRDQAGRQFDPAIVDAFEACYREGQISYAPEAARLLSKKRVTHPELQPVLS